MLQPAIQILNANRTMAVSTLRPDGWPQTTIVGYANEGWNVYFLILRNSQKFANIHHDDRISFAVASEGIDLLTHKAVYVGAHAVEMTDEEERQRGWRLLVERHPNLEGFESPDPKVTALMRARCEHVSVLDYSIALGHTEALTVHVDGNVTVNKPSEGETWRPIPA